MIVYKVVRVLHNGMLVSAAMAFFAFKLFYEVGKPAHPVCGKILAFDDLESAKRYVRSVSDLELTLRIYRAETTEAAPIFTLLDTYHSSGVEEFWSPGGISLFGLCLTRAPLGTVGCPDLTLLEEVKP